MKNKKGFIVYLDLLGYKNIIQNSKASEIKSLKSFVSRFINQQSVKTKVSMFYDDFDETKFLFRCYSDNFLIFYESEECDFGNLAISIFLGSYLIGEAIKNGYMLRGSVVYGLLSYDENIIFGKSIVEAYELENSHIEPTIVLSNKLKRMYEEDKLYEVDIISPFSFVHNDSFEDAKEFFSGIKLLVDRLNIQNIVDGRTATKYKWLISEFNRYFKGCASISLLDGPYHYSVSLKQENDLKIKRKK